MNRIFRNVFALGAFALLDARSGAKADIYFPGDATINYALPKRTVTVIGYGNTNDYSSKTNGSSPTIHLINGGVSQTLYSFNSSEVNVSGGIISFNLGAYDASTVNFSAGQVYNGLFAYNNSTVTVTGGDIAALTARANSMVNLSGGVFRSGIDTYDNSVLNLSGGYVDFALTAHNSSSININGGESSRFLYADDSSAFNFFGAGLSDALYTDHYSFGLRDYSIYILSGALTDGTDITGNFLYVQNGTGAKFAFNPTVAPEPGSVIFGISMTGVGFSVFRRRRR